MSEESEYSQLLRHPFWQRKRLEILQRDDFKCTKCGETHKNLQVHHLVYYKDTLPWDYPNDQLVTYCELCHRKVEFMKNILKKAPILLKKQGFESDDIREVINLLDRRLSSNHHAASAMKYMEDINELIYG